jgi:hypothetical protein
MPVLRRVVRSAYRRTASAVAGNPFKRFDAGAAVGELTGTGIEAAAAPRPEAMAALVERVSGDGRIRHVKDSQYLSWRFRRQDARYRFLFLGEDDLEGYAVLSPRRGGQVNVVDWEVAHPDLLADLLRSAIGLGRFRFLTVPWVRPSGPTIDALERIGFVLEDAEAVVSGESPFTVEVNVVRKSPPVAWMLGESNLLDPLDWDLRALYADGE